MEDTESQGSSAAHIYRYRGRSSFINTLDKEKAEGNTSRLVFTNVSHDDFKLLIETPLDILLGSFTFVPSDSTLTIKMSESSVHSVMAVEFNAAVEGWLASTGLDDAMLCEWRESFEGEDGVSKAGDCSFTIMSKYTKDGEVSRWPVMALEVGYSEKDADLENDAKTWMTITEGTVKAMLTMNWSSQPRTLRVRSWGIPHRLRDQDGFDPGLTQLLQEVVIHKNEEGQFCISPESKDRAIVISFDDIFASTTVNREHHRDFILDEHFLVRLAEQTDHQDSERRLRRDKYPPVVV